LYYSAWREANIEKVKAWREANSEKHRAYGKAYREANAEKRKANCKAWRETNPEKVKANKKSWDKNNPDKQRAQLAKRRAAKLQATPPWYSHDDCVAIYKELKPGLHLDHIVPLQGKNVCGLHWHHNLQLLPAVENIAKHNKFNPDTYVHELPMY
jgi:hypothetical protein